MDYVYLTTIAFGIDVIIGDPRYRFHPIILIGKLARKTEKHFNSGKYQFIKGLLSTLLVYGVVLSSIVLLKKSFTIFDSKAIELILGSILLYTTFALKSLNDHAKVILNDLKKGDLITARKHLSYIVGRKTDNLDEKEICRGVVESVSENLVDGVTAPLFYAFFFGLEGAFLYKTINTLDSLWGHRNERFEKFGKFAAIVDDVFNYIPSRLTAPIISLCSLLVTGKLKNSLLILFRDGRKHPSPNSGLSEAAMAGALGIRLGGENFYEGYSSFREYLGDENELLDHHKIKDALLIINLSSILFIFFITAIISLTH